jgi:hypothetical protein
MAGPSKLRTLRVPEDGRWEAADERARREGTSVSAILNAELARYGLGAQVQASGTMDGATARADGATA